MALPVLDGNQSATTLSSVVTGGEHIVAHSVVSLGANAIANITSAVSGSVVSISNFPATQPISGSISISGTPSVTFSSVCISNFPSTQTIAGTVTANVTVIDNINNTPISLKATDDGFLISVIEQMPPISGTVTAANLPIIQETLTSQNAVVVAGVGTVDNQVPVQLAWVNTSNGQGLYLSPWMAEGGGDVPVSGTVTVGAMPNGSLTTRFGTPVTANTAFATSAVTNASRKYLLIQNVTTGGNVITVGIGFTPTTTQGIQLTAGAGITFESSYIPTGAVYVLSSVTASNFTVLEA